MFKSLTNSSSNAPTTASGVEVELSNIGNRDNVATAASILASNAHHPHEHPSREGHPGLGVDPMKRPQNRPALDSERAKRRQKQREEDAILLGTVVKVEQAVHGFLDQVGKKRTGGEIVVADGVHEDSITGDDDEDDGEESLSDKVLEIVSIPLMFLFKYTVPDCREPEYESWYFVTFTMSIMHIGFWSFIMVDFAGRAGCVIGIPPLVMGLIVIAAGTSVPDTLASVLVAKNGQGDMAVANVLGSNVFNIFLGLGLPWFVRACIDGAPFQLSDEPIIVSVIILLAYVLIFIVVIHLHKWTLSPELGYIFIGFHLLFILWSLLSGIPADGPIISVGI